MAIKTKNRIFWTFKSEFKRFYESKKFRSMIFSKMINQIACQNLHYHRPNIINKKMLMFSQLTNN